MESKIKTQEEISLLVEKLKKEGKKIVTTNGSFDILHAAHVRLLQKAKKEGDILIVLLNDDASVRNSKGPPRPIMPQEDRQYLLSSLSVVDYVVLFGGENPLPLLKNIKPEIHTKGGSYIKERIVQEEELVKSWGGKLKTFGLEEGFSSTNILNKIINSSA